MNLLHQFILITSNCSKIMKNIFLLTIAFLMNALWLKAQTPCPNLVINGDFEVPNASFAYGLPFNAGCVFNTYAITTNFNLKCAAFPSFSARTNPGTGKFLVVQGGSAVNVWSTNVTVTPNTPYTFSFWVSGTTPYPTSLAMVVGGSNVPLSITVPSVSNWVQYTYSGTTPVGITNLPIAIRQLSSGEAYSYGIDDIAFSSCSPEPPCVSCVGNVSSPNLVANGSFTNGNDGSFTSGLTYSTGCATGNYGVTTSFNTFCSLWTTPTTANSAPNFLVLDGLDNGNIPTVLWKAPVSLTTATDYCFSFKWALAFADFRQNFPVSIEILNSAGAVVGTIGTQTIANNLNWTNANFTWNSMTLPSGNYFVAISQQTGSIYRDWGIDDICFTKKQLACDAAFTSAAVGSCGNYQFTNTSMPTTGLTYAWLFGDTPSGTNNTSTLQNPTHQFTTCGTYNVRLIITGTGCQDTAFRTVTVVDNTPPVITCPANKSLTCVSDTTPSVSGVATATDNCPNVTISYADTLQAGNLLCEGVFRRTWKATDACGNRATCVQTINVFDNNPTCQSACDRRGKLLEAAHHAHKTSAVFIFDGVCNQCNCGNHTTADQNHK